ncbi:MAG: hypothetical protein PHT60_13875 [Acidiphilium sp.]|nr:hypothetical protein [Acidiphilium sp.]MDD4936853.1 hypothetical protein [Acidiphilium sp.]
MNSELASCKIIRFPIELVRSEPVVLWDIDPDYHEIDRVMSHRCDEDGEGQVVPDYFGEAEAETLEVIAALDRTDPAVYRAALRKLVGDAVAVAVPACREWQKVKQEYFDRLRLFEANKDRGFFERRLKDYIPAYEYHVEAAYEAAQRAHGIARVVGFALEDKLWQPRDPHDLSWMEPVPPRAKVVG